MANFSRRIQPQELSTISKPSSVVTDVSQYNNVASSVELEIQTSSSYLTTDGSLMSRQVDRWIQGSDAQSLATPNYRVFSVQRSTLTSQYCLNSNGFYYALATVMPLLRGNNRTLWNCSPSVLMTMLEPVLGHLGEVYNRIRLQFQYLITDNGVQEMFTTTLDIIMVIYAIGFVVISMYESAIMA